MNILSTIIDKKQKEVAKNKQEKPVLALQSATMSDRPCASLKEKIQAPESTGIIAEFKRKSPSKGWINENADAKKIIAHYAQSGAAGISILTDSTFFGAQENDWLIGRRCADIPLLRKDFIIDPYQIYESKSMGADVILLIAKILTPHQIQSFTQLAHDLGMEVLLEMQDLVEIEANIKSQADLFGINNRDLTTFSIDYKNSIQLGNLLPEEKIKIAESGIQSEADIQILKNAGFKGFLIGSHFMQHIEPTKAFTTFISNLQS